MRSSLEHYYGFTGATDDLLTFEVRGPVLAMIVVAIWLGVVGGLGLGVSQGKSRGLSDLSWISPGAHAAPEGAVAEVSVDPMFIALSTGGDGRLRYLPFEGIVQENAGAELIALR